jgi:Ca2+-binding RTX toxin-like protein
VFYSGETVGMSIDLGAGTATGGQAQGDTFNSVEDVYGGTGNDTITGDGASNLLSGDLGDDVLSGGTGNLRDVLLGGAGNDTMAGEDGNDIVNGGGGRDSIDGGAGADIIIGGNSDDTISAGLGADILVFRIGWDDDVVTDWEAGIDRVRMVSGYDETDISLTQQGADVLLTLVPSGDTILFQNQLVADIDLNGDFIFV